MKTFFSVIAALLLCCASSSSFAQCSGRYYDKIFPGFFNWESLPIPTNLGNAVVYGSAVNNQGVTENLDMYIFQPQGDTLEKRPLIILAFGGSFVSGAKESPDIIMLCHEFVRRGYVTASIKYRLGANPVDSVNMLKAVMRGVQDARAAIRFFYKDAATTNTYRIDTNAIFMGGVSAGAFVGVHLGFITDSLETPQWLDDIAASVGGYEGTSGNPGYSSKIRGIINLAGAIGDTSWIDACDPPMVSMHGTDDGTVPYCSEVIAPINNVPLIEVDGSASMKARMAHLGLKNPFFTHRDGGHVDFTQYFFFQPQKRPLVDTTIWFVRDFLFEELTGIRCGDSLEQVGTLASPCGQNIDEGSVECTVNTSIKPMMTGGSLVAYPNPSGDVIYVEKPASFHGAVTLNVYDSVGKLVGTYKSLDGKISINRNDVGAGLFYITLASETESSLTARSKILFQ